MTQPNHGEHPEHGGPVVTIGLRDLYAQLLQLDRSISALGAKTEMLAQAQQLNQQSIASQLADIRHDINDHEARLRLHDAQRYVTQRGMWTAIGTIVPIVGLVVAIISLTIQ